MPTLLIVDDERNMLYSLQKGLRADGLQILTAETGGQGIDLVHQAKADVVLLDVRLPDISGLEAFERMRKLDPRLPVIIMTAHSTTETAIEAMKRGAYEYLLKPVVLSELRVVIAQALDLSRLTRAAPVFQHEAESTQDGDVERIVGNSPGMQQVYKQIGLIAGQDVNVLILGESGTGKELVARAIVHHSRRGSGPLLAINAAAIPEALLESELFGHERGSFTGADRRRLGKFEQAGGGTLFLDEIGDMPLSTQAKVLRVLQDGGFERVGGNKTIRTDARVIAATNHDLDAQIRLGHFRQDLYYRLNGFTIWLPPLRERRADIPLLVEYYVGRLNRELERAVRGLSDGAAEMLRRYDWPGNVRELQSALRYAFVHARGDLLTADCFPAVCHKPGCSVPGTSETPGVTSGSGHGDRAQLEISTLIDALMDRHEPHVHRRVHDVVDHLLLDTAMRRAGGNQRQAAKLLGISRTTLRGRLDAQAENPVILPGSDSGPADQNLDQPLRGAGS